MISNQPDQAELAQLVGARIMPRLQIDRYCDEGAYREEILSLVTVGRVLGFCVFGGTSERVAQTLIELREAARAQHRTLLFSADCEWGLPMRLRSGGTEFPDAMAIAETGGLHVADQVGEAIGLEMRALGIGWNFAPVADINSNPLNPIINTRAFGETAERVSAFACAFSAGLQRGRVAATAKHFPGHGDTTVDSHRALPTIDRSATEFWDRELVPFAALIRSGVKSVMLGHIAVPELAQAFGADTDEARLPATLSSFIIGLLRHELGFEGVTVTDAMEMQAITNGFGVRRSTLLAAMAGVDVILMPSDPQEAIAALMEDAMAHPEAIDQLRRSFERIEQLREFCAIPETSSMQDPSTPEHRALASQIAQQAIAVTGDPREMRGASLLIISDDRPQAIERAAYLERGLVRSSAFARVERLTVAEVGTRGDLDQYDAFAFLHRARGYLGDDPTAVTMPAVVRTLAKHVRRSDVACRGALLIGSPYLDAEFDATEPRCVLRTYSESIASIDEVISLFMS